MSLLLKNNPSKIILSVSLKDYFLENLKTLNEKSSFSIDDEVLVYSSDVLEKYCKSSELFELEEGKLQEKVLGMKLLEASSLNLSDRMLVYQDVAETSLILSSCFYKYTNSKILTRDYYINIGKKAYLSFQKIKPVYQEKKDFFKYMSHFLSNISDLIYLATIKDSNDEILKSDLSPKQASILGLSTISQNKVS